METQESVQGVFPSSLCHHLGRCCARIRQQRLVTIEPAIFLYMFSYFFYIVLFDLYAFNRKGEDELRPNLTNNFSSSNRSCISTEELDAEGHRGNRTGDYVEKETAIFLLTVGVTSQLPSVISCLVLGPLSDRFGRKPAMVVVLLGACFHAMMAVLIMFLHLPLYVFLVGGAVRGLTGGLAGVLTISDTYIADVSSRKWLTLRLGILEGIVYLAGTLSLAIGGAWIQLSDCNFKYIAVMPLVTVAATVLYFVLLVPESHKPRLKHGSLNSNGDGDTEVSLGRPSVSPKALFRGFQIFFCRGYPRWKLWSALVTMIVSNLNTTGSSVIITLLLLHKPLQWQPFMIGVYMGAHELVQGLALLLILPILVAIRVPDAFISLLGIVFGCIMSLSIWFVAATWQMFLVGIIEGIDSLVIPTLKAVMSKTVSREDQGALFSFIIATQVLAGVVAYVVYSLVFSFTVHYSLHHGTGTGGAGISFCLMAILYALTVPLMIAVLVVRRSSSSRSLQSVISEPSSPNSPDAVTRAIIVTGDEYQSSNRWRTEDSLSTEERQPIFSNSQESQRSYNSARVSRFWSSVETSGVTNRLFPDSLN